MRAMTQAENAGFCVYNTVNPALPVLVSVPHAGRDYPKAVFDNLRLPPDMLVRLEDRYADRLARGGIDNGVPTIIAHRARAWIDLNRDETDIDADMVDGLDRQNLPAPGAKQRGGLGLIPRRLSGAGDIWRRRFAIAEITDRIESYHRPYHAEITEILGGMRAKFGTAILLDLHSMPPIHRSIAAQSPQIVIGDLFGRSAHARFSEALLARIKQHGFASALNNPYAGDFVLRRHSDPPQNVHALQLEIDRSLYLNDILREPSIGVSRISSLISELVQTLADEALGGQTLMAAE
jgi:N-formylglutamate amidohydrolase